ncbi:MAG: hypothetical protein JO287_15505 [Pseudonocardiales bacterium]|nr:hypothetical protein [Pseudonocardiales bacterium]
MWKLFGAIAAIAVVAIAITARRTQRHSATDELSNLILATFSTEWSQRFATDEQALRSALAEGGDPLLRSKVAGDVGVVDVKLSRRPSPHRGVAATVLCDYRTTEERTKAEFDLPWEDTPADVRAEFLRTGRTEVFRKWTAEDTP